MTALDPGLMFVHGNQAESLRDVLVQWMRMHPLAPLENDVVLVQSNGVAQWLKMALAAPPSRQGCGIAAGVEFDLPARFFWRVYRAVLGHAQVPEQSPFDKHRLRWRLVRLLPQVVAADPVCYAPIARFLEDDADGRKRDQLAGQIADIFDQYRVYRADWLHRWEAGEDVRVGVDHRTMALAEDQCWQPALWRALVADVAADPERCNEGAASGVHSRFLDAVNATVQRPQGVPRRVMVFGISALPRQSLEVLQAIARWSQVLVCVNNPCQHYWGDIVTGRELLRASARRQRYKPGTSAPVDASALLDHGQPLLAAWGKQGRDYIALLDEFDNADERERYQSRFTRIDLFEPAADHMLGRLQNDILDLEPVPARDARRILDAGVDTSIRFHVAHSPQREVEILHDVLLRAFNDGSTPALLPRDVIVMVPDINAYAPHIRAVFGMYRGDVRHIPFTIADQGHRQASPLMTALGILLALPDVRLTVGHVLDLLDAIAVQRRFGIEASQVPLIRRWLREANIRWGLHGEHRAALDLPASSHNTWLSGFRRLLLGYAVGGQGDVWQGIVPSTEVGGLEADVLGSLVDLVSALEQTRQALSEPATPAVWHARLSALKADFFELSLDADRLLVQRLDTVLDEWRDACEQARLDEPLGLAIVARHWLEGLDQGGISQRFFAGAVTFATLMPMRAIPFRHVCLLGMNDGAYPRVTHPPDFDLMAGDYRPGDRSRREDDRYLFLEALLSARDHLHVSWVGSSIQDDSKRPPSVLVAQLRDHLAQAWRLEGCDPVSPRADHALLAAITLQHRLQPFSPAYFDSTQRTPGLTFAREWRESGTSLPVQHRDNQRLLIPAVITQATLTDFVRDPVKAFFRHALSVTLDDRDDSLVDHEPFALDGLDTWNARDAMIASAIHALQRGDDANAAMAACFDRLVMRGDLPPAGFGRRLAQPLGETIDTMLVQYRQLLEVWTADPRVVHEKRLECEGLPALLMAVDGLYRNAGGQSARIVLNSGALIKERRYRHDTLLRFWVDHLCLQWATDGAPTFVLGNPGALCFRALSRDQAGERLACLLDTWRQGMTAPLPLPVKAGFAWLKARDDVAEKPERARGLPPAAFALEEARKIYEDRDDKAEVRRDPHLRRLWPDFSAVLAVGQFEYHAERLLKPMVDAVVTFNVAGDVP